MNYLDQSMKINKIAFAILFFVPQKTNVLKFIDGLSNLWYKRNRKKGSK